jgi:hypothetical protein
MEIRSPCAGAAFISIKPPVLFTTVVVVSSSNGVSPRLPRTNTEIAM